MRGPSRVYIAALRELCSYLFKTNNRKLVALHQGHQHVRVNLDRNDHHRRQSLSSFTKVGQARCRDKQAPWRGRQALSGVASRPSANLRCIYESSVCEPVLIRA